GREGVRLAGGRRWVGSAFRVCGAVLREARRHRPFLIAGRIEDDAGARAEGAVLRDEAAGAVGAVVAVVAEAGVHREPRVYAPIVVDEQRVRPEVGALAAGRDRIPLDGGRAGGTPRRVDGVGPEARRRAEDA